MSTKKASQTLRIQITNKVECQLYYDFCSGALIHLEALVAQMNVDFWRVDSTTLQFCLVANVVVLYIVGPSTI